MTGNTFRVNFSLAIQSIPAFLFRNYLRIFSIIIFWMLLNSPRIKLLCWPCMFDFYRSIDSVLIGLMCRCPSGKKFFHVVKKGKIYSIHSFSLQTILIFTLYIKWNRVEMMAANYNHVQNNIFLPLATKNQFEHTSSSIHSILWNCFW